MSSLKDFEHYKAIVITMDDLIFNLNELRYDFSLLLYPKTFLHFSYQEYTRRLGTVKSMYSFVQEEIATLMNRKIENFVYDEKNLHNIRIKESADALLSFAKSKELKVILLTTHDATNAKQLLHYRHLTQDIDQVISLSDVCGDMPSVKLFYALKESYHLELEEMLVISSLTSVFKCLQYSPIDTIYVPDNDKSYFDASLSFNGVMNTLFDVLQYVLFGKYTSADIYKDFLGYDENMDEKQKASRYAYLKMKYENQPDILPIVEEVFSTSNKVEVGEMTKEFHQAFSDIEKKLLKVESEIKADASSTLLSFEKIRERDQQPIKEPVPVKLEEPKPILQNDPENTIEPISEDKLIFDQTQEFSLDELDRTMELSPINEPVDIPKNDKIQEIFDELEERESIKESVTAPQAASIEPMMADESSETLSVAAETEPVIEEDEKLRVLDVFLSGVLNLLTSIMIVSIGGLVYMCFYDMVEDNAIIRALFDIFLVGFANICTAIYEFIVQPFPVLSIYNATSVSPMFLQFIIIIFTVFFISSLYKIIGYFWHRHEYFEE
ncbi:HAD family hydrolase [Beduini massiliensis]|uniref:HAD family hydrolase n=1 Tax=Beduini massiliensis TaxID=1585974 RepID=UPI00059A87C0|nr:HAD family hydrolase [Beduini massiliensis]